MLQGLLQGPWLGIVIMSAMIIGLIWWCWWAMVKDKEKKED
jgi:hypothetical protein